MLRMAPEEKYRISRGGIRALRECKRLLADLCERFAEKTPRADRSETAGFLPPSTQPEPTGGAGALAQSCEHLFRREHGRVAGRSPRSSEIQREEYFPLSPMREIRCSPAEPLD